jgi:uncharacterized protein with GYD domain
MPRHLVRCDLDGDYFNEALESGFGARERAMRSIVESLGGELTSAYWAHGDDDLYLVIDLPDDTTLNALLLGTLQSSHFTTSTTAIFTSGEMDEARDRIRSGLGDAPSA